MSNIKLYMFQSGTQQCKVHDIKMNRGNGADYEIPVPWFLLVHPKGNVVYFYVRSFSLHLEKGEPGKPLEIGFRHSVSKNNYEDMSIGLEILMPYMCKNENGKVIIHDKGYLSCYSYYRSILVNPKTGEVELIIYRNGRFDHRQKPNTKEPRKWLNEDRIIKKFPSIRIVLLYIISCRYRQHFKNRDI